MPGIPAPPAATPSVITFLTKFFTSSFRIRPLRPLPVFIFTTSTPSSRANRRTDGEACALWVAGIPACNGSVTGCSTGGDMGSGVLLAGAFTGGLTFGAAACSIGRSDCTGLTCSSFASTVAINDPSETLSPALMCTCWTVPAALDGRSILALSVSSVATVCSRATMSPG